MHKNTQAKKEVWKKVLSKGTATSVVVRACPEGNHKQQDEVNSPSSLLQGFSLALVLQQRGASYRVW